MVIKSGLLKYASFMSMSTCAHVNNYQKISKFDSFHSFFRFRSIVILSKRKQLKSSGYLNFDLLLFQRKCCIFLAGEELRWIKITLQRKMLVDERTRMICVRVRSNGTNNNLQFHKSLKNELRPF